MLSRLKSLRAESGSVIVTALMVMAIMIPIGLALLAIVDTQARESGGERTRDRAFNLAESALGSAAVSLGQSGWPANAASAPSNSGPVGAASTCAEASYGATLGAATNPGSATARLQPNLNASYEDVAYTGATWQINVCDNDPTEPGATVWKDELLANMNYDANHDELVWVRSEAAVAGRRRVLAVLVGVDEKPALSSKYGLITGRINADLTNTAGALLSGELVEELAPELLGSDPLVAADPSADTTPPTSGVIAVRCGVPDGCLTGALAATSAAPAINDLAVGGKLVQATSLTAASEASIAQLKQQAIASGTYVATTAGTTSSSDPPACTIPAGANADTIVYIEQVGTTGTAGEVGGPGDQFCRLSVATNVTFKALVIANGRAVVRGDNTTNDTTVNTFRGLLYALNKQRQVLGDAATPTREVIRIDRGARVVGGVAADGKSAQVGIYPPGLCTSVILLGADVGCTLSALTSMLGVLNAYNPAITSDVSVMNAVKTYQRAKVVAGSYRDILGELR